MLVAVAGRRSQALLSTVSSRLSSTSLPTYSYLHADSHGDFRHDEDLQLLWRRMEGVNEAEEAVCSTSDEAPAPTSQPHHFTSGHLQGQELLPRCNGASIAADHLCGPIRWRFPGTNCGSGIGSNAYLGSIMGQGGSSRQYSRLGGIGGPKETCRQQDGASGSAVDDDAECRASNRDGDSGRMAEMHDDLRSGAPVDQQVQTRGPLAVVRDFLHEAMQNERLLAISVSTAITAMCHTALGPVLPVVAQDFGVSAAAIGTTVSAFAIARLLLNLPCGILADRVGRRPLMVAGPVVMAVGMAGSGLCGSFPELLAWRFLTGVGSAIQMSGSQLFLADSSTSSNRAKMLGTNQVAGLMGVSLGPAVGGLLADTCGLRAPFMAVSAASAASALYATLRLPETHPGILKRRAAAAAAAEAAEREAAQGAGQAAGGASQWTSQTPSSGAGGHGRGHGEPEQSPESSGKPPETPGWRQLLSCPDFQAIALVNCVLFMTVNGTRAVLIPILGMENFGMTPSLLGGVFASMAAINIIGVLPAAAAADKFGRKMTIVPAGVGLGAALCLMSCASSQEAFWTSALVFAAMNSAIGPSPAAYAADVIPKKSRGLGLGLYRSAGDVGLLLGPPLLGAIADASSIGVAMGANGALLVAASAWFAASAREVNTQCVAASGQRIRAMKSQKLK